MAVITDPTFDFLQQYTNVRIQQGVPIVDADLNELDDIRKFETRSNQKWLIGNGVPDGNDGFRIRGAGLANDFEISAGLRPGGIDPLGNVGHCIVNGLDVVIDADINYRNQPLHTSQPGAAPLAAVLGVPVIDEMPALPPPAANATVSVYLDVWERLLSPAEEPALIHPALGVESCARIERRWAIRTRVGSGVPQAGDADFLPVPADPNHQNEHSYYLLATVSRRPAGPGADVVHSADVVDRREQNLFMPPATLIQDTFGVDAIPYRRGEGRPGVSLRDAINALLRGELPATSELNLTADPAADALGRRAIVDGAGHIWLFGERSNGIWVRRFANGAWDAELSVSTGSDDSLPSAVLTDSGEIWIFWQRQVSPLERRIMMRVYSTVTGGPTAGEVQIATGVGQAREPNVVSDAAGDIWLFYRFGSQIMSMQSDLAGTWSAPEARTATGSNQAPFAVADNTGGVHLFYAGTGRPGTPERRIYHQFKASAAPWPAPGPAAESLVSGTGTSTQDRSPTAVELAGGDILVVWDARLGPGAQQAEARLFNTGAATWQPIDSLGPVDSDRRIEASLAADGAGGAWLVTVRGLGPGSSTILIRRYSVGNWGPPMNLTDASSLNISPTAIDGPGSNIWVFWVGDRAGNRDVLLRQVYPTI